jgi:hypothetical protein
MNFVAGTHASGVLPVAPREANHKHAGGVRTAGACLWFGRFVGFDFAIALT